MDTLANRLKTARKAAQMTQSELAKRSGLKQGTIAGLENGRTALSNPSIDDRFCEHRTTRDY